MNSYFGIFKMQFKGEMQYRAKAFSGVFTQFFWGLMYICLYTAFMKDGVVNGFSLSQMTTYVWLGQAFFAMRFIGVGKNVPSEIVNGNVCYKFVRPINIYNIWYAEYMGERLASTILRFIPILVVAFLLPQGFNMTLPVSLTAFGLFALSLILGFLITGAISMFTVNIIFKTLSPRGASGIVATVCSLLGGGYIPLPLMPQKLQMILNYMPFRFVTDLPFRIYIGNIDTKNALIYIAISVAWLVVLVALGKLITKKKSKKSGYTRRLVCIENMSVCILNLLLNIG